MHAREQYRAVFALRVPQVLPQISQVWVYRDGLHSVEQYADRWPVFWKVLPQVLHCVVGYVLCAMQAV
jgi:hypothetical protein